MTENPLVEESSSGSYQFVYIGGDGNVWVHPGIGERPKQITTDATGRSESSDAGENITYNFPQISSDGRWIAYRRDVGTPSGSGMQYTFGLWVHNLETEKSEQVLDELPGSFTWRPGTHQLTFAPAVSENYFTGNPPDASLAQGAMGLDVDTGKTTELVQPERGYSLAAFRWSLDGRYLGFDELVYIEGRGPFGYYDFNKNTYVSWEEQIGNYAWHPAESRIYYDYLTYVATGTEEIFYRELEAEKEEKLTDYTTESEYAFWPVVSPDGDQIAYLAGQEGLDNQTYQLMIQDFAGGEPDSLGSFVSVLNLSWSPDGSTLLFSAGPWDNQKVMAVNVSDGSATALGLGTMVDVAENVQ